MAAFDPASSDGCSVPAVLKRLIPALQRFCDACDKTACLEHDEAYWTGGSEADRLVADYKLFLAARAAIGDEDAVHVFNAVRNYGAGHWGTERPWHGGDRAWPEAVQAP